MKVLIVVLVYKLAKIVIKEQTKIVCHIYFIVNKVGIKINLEYKTETPVYAISLYTGELGYNEHSIYNKSFPIYIVWLLRHTCLVCHVVW